MTRCRARIQPSFAVRASRNGPEEFHRRDRALGPDHRGLAVCLPPAKHAPVEQTATQTTTAQASAPAASPGGAAAPTAPGAPAAPGAAGTAPAALPLDQALAQSPRVTFSTPELLGSISLKGARIDDVELAKHREELDPKSPPVDVLSPLGAEHPYYAEFGWSSSDAALKVPGPDSLWSSDAKTLEPGKPVHLTWDNGQGLVFALDIGLDEQFMFSIKQSVENKTDKPVTLFPWALVVRHGEPKAEGTYVLHEGPYGVFNGSLKEFGYTDFKDNKQQKIETTGGWVGITDKYWMATLVPDQKSKVDVTLKGTGATPETTRYQVDYVGSGVTVAAGAIGQHRKPSLRRRQDRARDRRLSREARHRPLRPHDRLGLVLVLHQADVLAARVALRADRQLRRLDPDPDRDREGDLLPARQQVLCGDEQDEAAAAGDGEAEAALWRGSQQLNQEMMQLYRREKVNPAAGCLPIVVQIPVFFALYKVLYTTIEMRHQPFFGWIKDLSAPDPVTILTGFGLFPWQVPEFLHFFNIGIWPLVMGVTMFLQQKLNPAPTDPVQARCSSSCRSCSPS